MGGDGYWGGMNPDRDHDVVVSKAVWQRCLKRG